MARRKRKAPTEAERLLALLNLKKEFMDGWFSDKTLYAMTSEEVLDRFCQFAAKKLAEGERK